MFDEERLKNILKMNKFEKVMIKIWIWFYIHKIIHRKGREGRKNNERERDKDG